MFCMNCGTQVPAGAGFCIKCGCPVKAPAHAAAAAPAPPPLPQAAPAHNHRRLVESLEERINHLASTEKLEGFSLRDMFSEVFKKHSQEQLDDYFIAGTAQTTPKIQDVQTGWPKPWFFMRVLIFVTALYAILAFAFDSTHNPNLVPGLIVMGAFAMPLSTLFLFFELNTPRNVPFHAVISLFCLGGVASLFITILIIDPMLSMFDWMGASSAGITEELSKLITVVILARRARNHKYMLNGLLFGAAVGAGFGAFESAGYAFRAGLSSTQAMTTSIWFRAALAPFMHVAWTAISAAALWRSKGDRPLGFSAADLRFWKTFLIPMTLHIIWNSPLQLPLQLTHIAVGVVAWYVVFGLTQQGLRQVKEEQLKATREVLNTTVQAAAQAV